MSRLDSLTPEQDKLLKDYFRRMADANTLTPADRRLTTALTEGFYAKKGREVPEIVWCQSPWQLLVMPIMLEILVEHGIDGAQISILKDTFANPLFSKAFTSLIEQLEPRLEKLTEKRCGRLHDMFEPLPKRITAWQDWPTLGRGLRRETLGLLELDKRMLIAWLVGNLANQPSFRNRVRLEVHLATKFDSFDAPIDWQQSEIGPSRLAYQLVDQLGQELCSILFSKIGSRPFTVYCSGNPLDKYVSIFNAFLGWSLACMSAFPRDDMLSHAFLAHCGAVELSRDNELIMDEIDIGLSCLAFSFFENVAFVCDGSSSVQTDEDGRLHSLSGPAISFVDGYELYAINGVVVEEFIVMSPESITSEKIEHEHNAEIRRVMLESFGLERYFREVGADLIDSTDAGKLYRKPMFRDEDLFLLEVTNSTAETDGSYKKYVLRVPPFVGSAKEAVAWTFGLSEEDYDPSIET